MKIKIFFALTMLNLLTILMVYGQPFTWVRSLEPAISTGWHYFMLPPEILAKTKADFADLRIIAIGKKGDTTEVPYFLNSQQNKNKKHGNALNILNKTSREGLFYYTLEQPDKALTLNEIELGFAEKNFDINVNLEGSLKQEEWFSILKEYRLTGIKNNKADFQFTTLMMPFSNYKYYRLSFAAKVNPGLLTANTAVTMKQDDAAWWIYPDAKNKRETNNIGKETVSIINLQYPLPVSLIQVHIADSAQYIRPVTIQVVPFEKNGSVRKEDPFVTITSATLNSFDNQIIEVPNIITERVKVVIYNADNMPLKVDSITLKSSKQQMITRLPEAEKYLLFYGNKNATAPDYDLQEVFANMPLPDLRDIAVGPEKRNLPEKPKSWWEKDVWLYALMGLIIVMLGGFTVRMMRKR